MFRFDRISRMLFFLSCTASWLGLDWAIVSISIYCYVLYYIPVRSDLDTQKFKLKHGIRAFSDYVTSGVHCCHQKSFLASFHTFSSTSSSLREPPKRLIFCYQCVHFLFRPPVSDHFVAMFSKTTIRHSLSSPNPRPNSLLRRSLMSLCLLSGHCFLRQRCLHVLY